MLYCSIPTSLFVFFFFNDTATTEIYTLSLHDALPICYLSDERDGRALAAGLKLAREFVMARPMAEICSSELAPGAHVRSDAELMEYVRSSVATLYHPVGTCAMGGESRWNSVVDPELRVRGLTGLRVVDASVMPVVPRGNTNAPTIAIAERAADLIAGRAPLAAVNPADPVDAMVIAAR